MDRAYEFRIYPNAHQRDLIERIFGCCRWVYNRVLEERMAEYAASGKSASLRDGEACAVGQVLRRSLLHGLPRTGGPAPAVGTTGIDAGIHDIATCSTGERLENPDG